MPGAAFSTRMLPDLILDALTHRHRPKNIRKTNTLRTSGSGPSAPSGALAKYASREYKMLQSQPQVFIQ